LVLILLLALAPAMVRAQAPELRGLLSESIAPQPLSQALAELGKQSGLELFFVSEVAEGLESHRVEAGTPVLEALRQMLEGSGLQYEFVNDRAVRVVRAGSSPQKGASQAKASPLVYVQHASPLEELLVTAFNTKDPARTTPTSLVEWSADDLYTARVVTIADLAALTPSLQYDSFPEDGTGLYTNVAIRGINARNGTTVGVVMDDVPLPAPGAWGGSFGRAFPALFDVQRVDVLRGPQGMALGEGASAGALRYVWNDPSLQGNYTQLRASIEATQGGGPSYDFGAVNGGAPVPGSLGYRISAWHRESGGYVDRVNPFTGEIVDPNANRSETTALRGAVTYAPAEAVRLTPSLYYQNVTIHDTSSFYTYLSDPAAGELRNGKLLRQPITDQFVLGSIHLAADVASGQFTATLGAFDRQAWAQVDATNDSAYGGWGNPLGPEYPVSYTDAIAAPRQVSQRVWSLRTQYAHDGADQAISWLAGVDATSERNHDNGGGNATAVEEFGPLATYESFDNQRTQFAGYAQVRLALGRRTHLELGTRVAHARYDTSTPTQSGEAQETVVSPRLSLTFEPAYGAQLYALVSQGYRPGWLVPTDPGGPCEAMPRYKPDSLWNYELGTKGQLLGHRLTFEADAFHMVWTELQEFPTAFDNTCRPVGNAGSAQSNGVDFSAEANPAEHWLLRLAASYAHAEYTDTIQYGQSVYAERGAAIGSLPIVPSPWQVVGTAQYAFPVGYSSVVTMRAQDVYHSRSFGPFITQNPAYPFYALGRQPDPATNVLDLRLALEWPRGDVSLFVTNALNSQPLLTLRNRCCVDTLFYGTTLRPRTFGLSAGWLL
jgi:outer membrane receptor protein involved in Fe transport